jgi:asparagine synthase (glutamine-hydrolysing)
MCGIAGVIQKGGPALHTGVLDRSLQRMLRRGPDDGGICQLSNDAAGVNAVLGHRRLSILDLSPLGHQPMSSADGNLTVAFNGEIYNYREIRGELQAAGYQFKSNCDTEVILAAYDKWGTSFIDRCNGMFAIALWDQRGGKVLLYRDRIGIKPLFYGFQDNRFYFGSVLSAISETEGFRKEIDHDALLAYLWLGHVPAPFSMFRGIGKLLPGHMAELDLAKWRVTTGPYWRLTPFLSERSQMTGRSESELVDGLDTLLRDAVKLQLVSDVPLGAFLSGGIDSSTVVAMMKQVHNGDVRTFSIGFNVESYNEAPQAKAISRHLDTAHEELILSAEDVRKVISEIPDAYDEPFSDSSCLPTMLLSRMTRNYVTVALSGDGGDELFWGDYHHYRVAEHWKLGRFVPAVMRPSMARMMSLLPGRYAKRIIEALECHNFGEYHCLVRAVWQRYLYRDLIDGEFSQVLDRLPVISAANETAADMPVAKSATTLDFYSNLPDCFLVKVDRASMASSLEVRVPLLDHRVVEFSRQVPDAFYCRQGHKHMLKKVLERYVPRQLWERPKKGFGVPLAQWFRGDLRQFLHDSLFVHRDVPFINHMAVQRMFDDHQSGRLDNARMLWSLLSLAMWYEKNM